MIDFKNIVKLANPERMEYLITVQGNPVWDYKIAALNTISIISTIQQGLEGEYVTFEELRKYIVSSEIPFELVKIQTEEKRFKVIEFEWKDENRELCLIYDNNYV